MKLVAAIVQDYDTDHLLRALTAAGLQSTRIASTGGFLRRGNTTVLTAVHDAEVPKCLEILRSTCQSRTERPSEALLEELSFLAPGAIAEVTIGGAVVFVARISRYERIASPRPAVPRAPNEQA